MISLKDRYGSFALITGASSGIGEEFAKRLASDGMNLILVARRKERLEKVKQEIGITSNVEIILAPLDLLADNFLDELKGFVADKEIGMLINNAGFGYRGEFINSNSVNEANMVKLNCVVPIILTHYFVKQMVDRKKGAIIFLASLVAFQPTPTTTTYAATKAFNGFLSDGLWYELKKHNIDVLSLNPGGTATEFQAVANSTPGPFPRTTKQVVATAMKSLGKKPSVIDGFYNKVLVVASRFIPRKLTVLIAGKISESLYRKN